MRPPWTHQKTAKNTCNLPFWENEKSSSRKWNKRKCFNFLKFYFYSFIHHFNNIFSFKYHLNGKERKEPVVFTKATYIQIKLQITLIWFFISLFEKGERQRDVRDEWWGLWGDGCVCSRENGACVGKTRLSAGFGRSGSPVCSLGVCEGLVAGGRIPYKSRENGILGSREPGELRTLG